MELKDEQSYLLKRIVLVYVYAEEMAAVVYGHNMCRCG